MRARHRLGLVPLLAVLACAPASARADWTIFIPHTFETHSWIDLYGLYESDGVTANARQLTFTDLFFKEKLTLQTTGYFYHPRFVRYRLLVSGALKQETFEQSSLPPQGTRRGHGLEYDARVFFLPEHPYNLELFATRYEPLYRQEYTAPFDTISTSVGADFRYRQRPWFLHARLSDEGLDSGGVTTDIRKLNLEGKYFKDFADGRKLSVDVAFSPSRLTGSNGFASDATDSSFGNTLESRRLRLYSNLTQSRISQEGGATTLQAKSRLFAWYEQVTADLPYRFRADAFWRYQNSNSEFGAATDPENTTLSNLYRNVEFDLKHQLYESLQSTYVFRWDSNSSGGGGTTALNDSLTFNYTKQIFPVDGRLTAGLSLGEGETRNTGQSQVVDELHPAVPVPGTFVLNQPNADPQSTVVFVRSPQPPFDLVRLTENLNYTVATVGNSLEITVLALPVEFPVPGKYDFRVSYSLAAGDFKIRIRSFSQSANLALFDSLLTPYYTFSAVKSDVLSGVFPGGGIDAEILTAGLSFLKGPLRARLEYADVRWATSPWRGWKGEVQLVGPIGPATNLSATARYQDRHFAATEGGGALPAYTETEISASGSLQQFLVSRSLSIVGGGSYSRIQGLSESRTYGLNATLSWKIGKLDVAGGATYTDSQSQSGTAIASRNVRQYYYLRLRRVLF